MIVPQALTIGAERSFLFIQRWIESGLCYATDKEMFDK